MNENDNIDLEAILFSLEFEELCKRFKPGDSIIPYLNECLGNKLSV